MRWLGPVVLAGVLLLAGCGSGHDRGAATPTSTSTSAPDFRLVRVLSASSGSAGRLSKTAVPVPDADAARRFAQHLGGSKKADLPDLAAQVIGAVDTIRVPGGEHLYAAVVSQQCVPPTAVEVSRSADGFTVTAVEAGSPTVLCLIPVTSVALVLIST